MSYVGTILKDSSEPEGVHQNFTNVRHISGRCKKEYVWDLMPLEKQAVQQVVILTTNDLFSPWWSFLYILSSFRT